MGVNIGLEIKRAREAAGLSQSQLAELCGWETQGKVSHLETQRRKLEFYDMVKIEDALKVERGTLYARARGELGGRESDLEILDRLSPAQAEELIRRLLRTADLDVYQRSRIARLMLESHPSNPEQEPP